MYDVSYVALAAAVQGRAFTADATLLSAVAGTEYADRLEHGDGYA